MTKLIYSLVIVITLFIGLTFAYMNNQTVQLKYLTFESEVSLALLLLCTLVIGIVTGYMVSWVSSLKVRRNLSEDEKGIEISTDSIELDLNSVSEQVR